MSEADYFAGALREIAAVCARPFGKDARRARRIALDALKTCGRRTGLTAEARECGAEVGARR